MNSFQIRQKFLDYFHKQGHTIVPSSSLIPAQDPTILFANAGMNQFKDIFLGKEKRSYTRATTAQKCVRAGGKHNDLDAVGFTERHLTFFEMLGNFSFGDYFKKEAISFAWELLTKEIGLPAEKLYISVFREDDEAYNLWHDVIGVPEHRIIRLDEKDNFWQMGDTGPCGPCSEIYVDCGTEKGCQHATCAPGCDCCRFVEIWNLVFMQFDRQSDGSLKPLQSKGVDTGMGLERLCMVMQNKNNVYETDIFQFLIKIVEDLSGKKYDQAQGYDKAAYHVLSDHVRSCCLLIADGCTPSNDGRGYVLRKIIRRAALFAKRLSSDMNLFPHLAQQFIDQMGCVFPELIASKPLILNLLTSEVERFDHNLQQGQHIFERYLQESQTEGLKELSGEYIFKLYDTYGFPPELTRVMASEQGMQLDIPGFEREMKKQQAQSGKKSKETEEDLIIGENVETTFVGYEKTKATSPVLFVKYVDDYVWIITEQTPFYVESGGQASDTGYVIIKAITYPVLDLKKVGNNQKFSVAVKLAIPVTVQAVKTPIEIGDSAECVADEKARSSTEKNHTATHLLQAALVKIVGSHIKQAGSLVSDKYVRFDFTNHEALSKEQIETVEQVVNDYISQDVETSIYQTTLDKAKQDGVTAFFDEKYNPEKVRVVQVPGISAELCGGTHVKRTGLIGCFKIVSESALSAGTRRILAVTGPEALKLFQQSYATVKKLSDDFKVKPEEVVGAIQKLQEHYQESLGTIKGLKKQLYTLQIPQWLAKAKTVGQISSCFVLLENTSADQLRIIAQEAEKHLSGFFFILGKDLTTDRYSFVALLAKTYEKQYALKDLAAMLVQVYGWKGGGNASMIQGGGQQAPDGLEQRIENWLAAKS